MMERIEVTIEPKDFAAAPEGYHGTRECVLWQALTRMFPDKFIYVGALFVNLDNDSYKIPANEWGVGASMSLLYSDHPRSSAAINKLSKAAKISLEGIPTIKLVLTKAV